MKSEFIIERQGRKFVLYAGLLDVAHEKGLKSITTTLIQAPTDGNGLVAIVHATVEVADGVFTGLGDADPNNVSRMMVPHLIRFAETRAKARALRDAVNVGVAAFEEMGDLDARESESPALNSTVIAQVNEPFDGPPDHRDAPAPSSGRAPYNAVAGGQSVGSTPATEKQLQTIERMARAAGKPAPTGRLTRGQASEIISGLVSDLDKRAGGG